MAQVAENAVAERVLEIRRIFNAPREVVFEAWTNPEQLAQWWGPKGFTNPRCEADARPGGAIHIDMRAPNGAVYPMSGEFREVTPPERLVFTSSALDERGNAHFVNLNTIEFAEFGKNRTMMTLHAQVLEVISEQALGYLKGMNLGWSLSIDRLEAFLPSQDARPDAPLSTGTTDRELSVTRVFDAPQEVLFRMWTEPEHVAQWWGPKGFTNTIYEMDLRPRGTWLLAMHGPNGVDYISKSIFVEIDRPNRLIFDHVTPPFRMTVTFRALGDKTEVTARTVFESAELLAREIAAVGADKGLVETMDSFAEYVAKH
jgi:uncharacterized protein YndB with AHSA1/START domain